MIPKVAQEAPCSPGGGRGWLHPQSENHVKRDFSRVDYVRKMLDRTHSLLRPCLQNLTAMEAVASDLEGISRCICTHVDVRCLPGQHAKVLRIALRLLELISGSEQLFPDSVLLSEPLLRPFYCSAGHGGDRLFLELLSESGHAVMMGVWGGGWWRQRC